MISNIANYFIKWMRHKYMIAGVPVIIKNSKGEILLGKRTSKPIFYSGMWGLPGGMIEYNESIENAGIREIKEELGVKIKILRRGKAVYEDFPNKNCQLHLLDIPLYAEIVSGKPKPKDETQKVGWFSPKQIQRIKLAYNHKKILKGEGII